MNWDLEAILLDSAYIATIMESRLHSISIQEGGLSGGSTHWATVM